MTASYGDTAFLYDSLKRRSRRYCWYFKEDYTYRTLDNGQTTTQVASINYTHRDGGPSFEAFQLDYTYDNVGNIATVSSTARPELSASYTYDTQGQLLTEQNHTGNWTYVYDGYGNIRSTSNGTTTNTYTYGDANWIDLLTAYNGQSITYDEIGNPLSYYNGTRWNFTWQNGRQLATASKSGTNISYTYDITGVRDSKTVNGTTYNYITQNGQVVRQTWPGHTMDFVYDEQNQPRVLIYDGVKYRYVLNQQGDVIGIVNTSDGTSVAKYAYDAWGNIISIDGELKDINPLRYRGYYYDTETGFYYLQSRYYDPSIKRFINADGYASTGAGFVGYNMFAYCNNNAACYLDLNGNHPATAYMLTDGGCWGGGESHPVIKKPDSRVAEENVSETYFGGSSHIPSGASNISISVQQGSYSYGHVHAIADKTLYDLKIGVVGDAVSAGIRAMLALAGGAPGAVMAGAIDFAVPELLTFIFPDKKDLDVGNYDMYAVTIQYDMQDAVSHELVHYTEEYQFLKVFRTTVRVGRK